MSKPKKKKRTVIQKLRDRERRRRMVPPVVLARRIAASKIKEDPGIGVLNKSTQLSKHHARQLRDLVIRSMGLTQAPRYVKERFELEGLDGVGMDAQAAALISQAVRQISAVLIFQLVAKELVNDKALREHLVELFVRQRFDAVSAPVTPPPKPPKKEEPNPISRELVKAQQLISNLMDL